ncbi:MAG: alpha/beta fold hydrolase [Anaerolineales bacterium]|jgi:carboxylesterase
MASETLHAMLTPEGNQPWFLLGGPVGCLLVHGFTGAPNEMRGLGNYLNRRGYTVLGVRLFAHGTSPSDMVRARWRDWVVSCEDGYWILKGATRKIVVMGLSMGALLSLELASRLPVRGVVALSTPIRLPKDWRLRYARWLSVLVPRVGKGPPDWVDPSAAKDHVDYPGYPVRAIAEMDALVRHTRDRLSIVKAPVLVVQSRTDQSVPPESAEELFGTLHPGRKELLWVERSGHVVTEDVEHRRVWRACAEWVHSVCRDDLA